MEKRPIADTLRKMSVGGVEYFPLTQYNSVRSTVSTVLLAERAEGLEWKYKLEFENRRVAVERTA